MIGEKTEAWAEVTPGMNSRARQSPGVGPTLLNLLLNAYSKLGEESGQLATTACPSPVLLCSVTPQTHVVLD